MRWIATAAVIAAMTLGCYKTTPDPGPDPLPPTPADCSAACANGARLKCSFAAPTPGGAACEAVCNNIISQGGVEMDLACIAAAKSCEAIDKCR